MSYRAAIYVPHHAMTILIASMLHATITIFAALLALLSIKILVVTLAFKQCIRIMLPKDQFAQHFIQKTMNLKKIASSNPLFIPEQDISLHDKNWFATGGKARYFSEPTSSCQWIESLQFAQMHDLPVFILGQGANILMSDQGFDGLVIRPQLTNITITESDHGPLVTAGAGVIMNDLIEWCLERNLVGLEEFSGIPGTVGGSVYINLHYYDFLIEHFLVSATVLEKSHATLQTVDPSWFNFGYDQSTLQNGTHYLANATFRLKQATELATAFACGRRIEIIRHRNKRYPTKNTCGSFFRNFHDHEVTHMSNGKKMIYVAYYLDKLGIKGELQVGDALVSHQHANMLVNKGKATSTDIISLARIMQERVFEQFGIMPQPECQLIGFSEYPLYR